MLTQPAVATAGDAEALSSMQPDRDRCTFKRLDVAYGLIKGSAFRAFKRALPALVEGVDFQCLDATLNARQIEELKQRGWVYSRPRNVVVLSSAGRAAVEHELKYQLPDSSPARSVRMNVTDTLQSKLIQGLSPLHLEVVNESHAHNVPDGSESHFKVLVVAEAFDGQSLLSRHRVVNALLARELAGPVHALSIHAHTPEEWFERGGRVPESPPCLGGNQERR